MEFARTAPDQPGMITPTGNDYPGGGLVEPDNPAEEFSPAGFFVGIHGKECDMRLLIQIGLVAFGSALGGLARWGVGAGAARLLGSAFPWGTFIINISGSLFLGWFSTVLSDRWLAGPGSWLRADDLRLMVAVGFTGAYTTFSTFEYESDKLFRDGEGLLAMTYLFGSVFLGLLSVRCGILLGRWR
jgi:CrcB protein